MFDALRKIHKMGPKYVIIKKGSHGSILSEPEGLFLCPAYPLKKVTDPTGAGDSFVGGMIGYLAKAGGSVDANIRKAMVYGSEIKEFVLCRQCHSSTGIIPFAKLGFDQTRTNQLQRMEIGGRRPIMTCFIFLIFSSKNSHGKNRIFSADTAEHLYACTLHRAWRSRSMCRVSLIRLKSALSAIIAGCIRFL